MPNFTEFPIPRINIADFVTDAEDARDAAIAAQTAAEAAAAIAGMTPYLTSDELPDNPVPADGTWGAVLTATGMQAWRVVSGAWVFQVWVTGGPDVRPTPSAPVLLDLFTLLHARGQLAAETNYVDAVATTTATASAGGATISVSSTTIFTASGMCTVLHTDGVRRFYTVTAIGSGTLALSPLLVSDVASGAEVTKVWWDTAHLETAASRALAQYIARMTEVDNALPAGTRTAFSLFDDLSPRADEDTLTAVGTGTVNYYAVSEASLGAGFPPRFNIGAYSAYVGTPADGDGAQTALFALPNAAPKIARVYFQSMTPTPEYLLSVLDQDDAVIASQVIPASLNNRAPRQINLVFRPGTATAIRLKITATSNATESFIWDAFDVFDVPQATGPVITGPAPRIVCFGDSNTAGDGTQARRESYVTQLALELPHATIINAGIGGDDVYDLRDRFDTAVTPYSPDYVILWVGVNDVFSPSSATFDPNAIDNYVGVLNGLIAKIVQIGARPIIISVPPLSETSGALPTWTYNDRARSYNAGVLRELAPQPTPYTAPAEEEAGWTAWTPTIYGGTVAGAMTPLRIAGLYQKVGNRVDLICEVVRPTNAVTTAPEGVVLIGGLPFSPDLSSGMAQFTGSCSIGRVTHDGNPAAVINSGAIRIRLYPDGTAADPADLVWSAVTGTLATFYVHISYLTAS